jgi:hypothetical protein
MLTVTATESILRGAMLKQGEVIGVWVWGIVVWIILAFAFGDFWWFRPLYRQVF